MCVVSMVMDHYHDEWGRRWVPDQSTPPWLAPHAPLVLRPVTQEEVDEFRRLLDRARAYDRRNNEPDCGMDEKRAALKLLAEQMGVDISFVDEEADRG